MSIAIPELPKFANRLILFPLGGYFQRSNLLEETSLPESEPLVRRDRWPVDDAQDPRLSSSHVLPARRYPIEALQSLTSVNVGGRERASSHQLRTLAARIVTAVLTGGKDQ